MGIVSARFASEGVVAMPLSSEQILALKQGDTKISFQMENPKKPGSKAWERFEKYKGALTIAEAQTHGAKWEDLSGDFEKAYMKFTDLPDVEMVPSTKRAAPSGTPDREAEARAKQSYTELVPKALNTEMARGDAITTSKVEFSAATMSALRTMMREEINRGVTDMEAKLMTKMEDLQHDLAEEKSARKLLQQEVQEGNLKYQQLEGRIAELEHKNAQHHSNVHVDGDDLEHIDKSIVVVGGFNEKTVEEAEALVQQMMVGIAGYKSVEMIDGESPLGLATFDSPIQAMKFIRSQKKNGTIHTNKLWASENRSRTERARCKIVSKIKKFLIEVQGLAPANIIASYKSFRVVIRDQGKLVPVAFVGGNLGLEWLDASSVVDGVREAMDAFIQDLE